MSESCNHAKQVVVDGVKFDTFDWCQKSRGHWGAHVTRYGETWGGWHLRDCRAGVLFRWGSLWIGAHWAGNHKRLCVNLIPCVTLWLVLPGGDAP